MPSTKVIVLVAVFGAIGTVTAGAAATEVFVGESGGAVSMEVESWGASNETSVVETTTTTADTDPVTDDESVQPTTVTNESAVDESVSNISSESPSDATESTSETQSTNATNATNTVDSSQSINSTETTQATNTTESLEYGTDEESSQSSEPASTDTASTASTTTDSIDNAVATATRTLNDTHQVVRDTSAETVTTSAELAGVAKRTVEERGDEVLTVTDDVSTVKLLDEYEGAPVTRTTLPARFVDIESGAGDATSGVEEAADGTSAAISGSGIDAGQRASDQDAGIDGVQVEKEARMNRNQGRVVSTGLAKPTSDRFETPFSGWGGPQFRPAATAALTVLAVGFACTGAAGVISPVTGWGALSRRATDSIGRSVRSSGVDRFVPLPGYSRYDDSDPLENELRREIYETVSETPGVHRARIAEEADVSPATVRYHERVLERERLVKSEKIGGRQRLYPLGFDDVELAAALEDDATAGVLAAIVDEDPVPVSEIAARVGRCPGTVSYHLDRLEDAGLIEREGLGNTVQVRAKPPVHAAVTAERDVARQ